MACAGDQLNFDFVLPNTNHAHHLGPGFAAYR